VLGQRQDAIRLRQTGSLWRKAPRGAQPTTFISRQGRTGGRKPAAAGALRVSASAQSAAMGRLSGIAAEAQRSETNSGPRASQAAAGGRSRSPSLARHNPMSARARTTRNRCTSMAGAWGDVLCRPGRQYRLCGSQVVEDPQRVARKPQSQRVPSTSVLGDSCAGRLAQMSQRPARRPLSRPRR
jgi:hypothetical protein